MPGIEVIPAFLASPSDVADERAAAREVVERVNKALAALGMRVELYGWEDQPPDFGRPQGLINPRVDEAELFIGLIWRRWGTPSGEGFTSGFEEEYRRAVARRRGGETHPRIWLFFKDVDPAQIADAGDELTKVLAFKEQVQSTREVLFRGFASRGEWSEQLHDLLANFLVERAVQRGARSAEPVGSTTAPSGGSEIPASSGGSEIPASSGESQELEVGVSQLLDALNTAASALREPAGSQVSASTAMRLLLASFDWVSRQSTGGVLDTHEANLLYRRRADIEPTPSELLQLLRSMVTGGDVRPGWAWLEDLSAERGVLGVALLARTDSSPDVRRAALDTLGDAAPLAEAARDGADDVHFGPDAFLRAVADDGDLTVRQAAMGVLGRTASEVAVELLRSAMTVPDLKYEATEGLVRALLRHDPNEALHIVVREGLPASEPLQRALLEHASDFDAGAREAMRVASSAAHRQLALRIDAAGGFLTDEETGEAVEDTSADVRVLAVDLRLEFGWPVSQEMVDTLPEGIADAGRLFPGLRDAERGFKLHRSWTEEALRQDLNWYLARGAVMYEALGRAQFTTFGGQVRRDLDDQFAAFREDSLRALHERFPGADLGRLTEESPYTEPAFTAAALEVLAEHGTSDDRARVLRYVDATHEGVQVAALHALRTVGSPGDADEAARVAKEAEQASAAIRREAAAVAISLSADAAVCLLDAEDPGVLAIAIAGLGTEPEDLGRLKTLLAHPIDSVRLASVAKLIGTLDDVELQGVLREYLEPDVYFYNVVVWLDRALYSPEPLKQRYKDELAARAARLST